MEAGWSCSKGFFTSPPKLNSLSNWVSVAFQVLLLLNFGRGILATRSWAMQRFQEVEELGCRGKPWVWIYPPGLGSVVNNHDDRNSPKDRIVGPLTNGRTLWLINGGDPNDPYVHPGMILQAGCIPVAAMSRLFRLESLNLKMFHSSSWWSRGIRILGV